MPFSTADAKRQNSTDMDGDHLLEYANSRGLAVTVDREKGLISGVKILGHHSKNGREYTAQALVRAVGLYEGKQVNVDHVRPGESRSYRDRVGRLQNIKTQEDGLYGDLFVNPQHVLAEQLFWDAEHAPENVGLSHDVSGKVTHRNGKATVEAINVVRSVDLVADPATTVGLFEDIKTELKPERESMSETTLKESTLEQLTAERPDLLESCKKTLAESAESKAKDEQLKQLTEELATVKATVATAELKAAIAGELQEAQMDPTNKTACSKLFLETLANEPDAAKRKAIVEDRKALLDRASSAGTPISESRYAGGGAPETIKATDWRD